MIIDMSPPCSSCCTLPEAWIAKAAGRMRLHYVCVCMLKPLLLLLMPTCLRCELEVAASPTHPGTPDGQIANKHDYKKRHRGDQCKMLAASRSEALAEKLVHD